MINRLALAWLPMGLATLGAWLDERRALGFSIWRGACRAAGLSPSSVAAFTLELLPSAVVGALLGSLLLLLAGISRRPASARGALAAHAGCFVAMPAGFLLCTTALPSTLTIAAEAALAMLATATVWWFTRIRKATYSGARPRVVPRIPGATTEAENFSVNHPWISNDCK